MRRQHGYSVPKEVILMAKTNIMAEKRATILRMVQIALLAAIEVVLTLLYIPIGTINLNFGLVPIVIAAVCLSPISGALIGAVSGIVTMIQVLTTTGSVFYVCLVTTNPVAASILCVVKTATAGLLAGLVYRIIRKKSKTIGSIVASVLCPTVNTAIFALGMLTIFGDALMAHPEISTWTTGGLLALVFIVLIGVNYFVELASTVVIGPVLSKALWKSKFFK